MSWYNDGNMIHRWNALILGVKYRYDKPHSLLEFSSYIEATVLFECSHDTGTVALCLWAELFGKLNAYKYSWSQFNIASKDGSQWLIYVTRNTTDVAKVKTNLILSYSFTKWKVCDCDVNAVQ